MADAATRPPSFDRSAPPELADRIPPGQTLAADWPVLTYGLTPRVPEADWRVVVDGLVGEPRSWSLPDLHALPAEDVTMDVHCVTGWSKLDLRFSGVRVRDVLDRAGVAPEAGHVLLEGYDGCSANLPLSHVLDETWLVWAADGAPLDVLHGGPLRLVTRGRYFWKSLKWVNRITVLAEDAPGFWERLGYHNDGDPWREQRTARHANWRPAVVVDSREETPTLRTLTLQVEGWAGHEPGQHVSIGVPHGESRYFRSYSIGSAPGLGRFQITVDRLDGGLFSPWLHRLRTGDTVEVAGPGGARYVLRPGHPSLFIGGGSGVVPLMSMMRSCVRDRPGTPWHLVVSVRTPEDLPFADELTGRAHVCYTRRPAAGDTRTPGRLRSEDLSGLADSSGLAYVCGSTGFVEHVGALLMELGYPRDQIVAQRYGPG